MVMKGFPVDRYQDTSFSDGGSRQTGAGPKRSTIRREAPGAEGRFRPPKKKATKRRERASTGEGVLGQESVQSLERGHFIWGKKRGEVKIRTARSGGVQGENIISELPKKGKGGSTKGSRGGGEARIAFLRKRK